LNAKSRIDAMFADIAADVTERAAV
jgi:hypothetical protein